MLGSVVALVLSSLLFGALHFANPGATAVGALEAAAGGVVFGCLYMLTRSLWLAIGAHWAADFWQGSLFWAPRRRNHRRASADSFNACRPEAVDRRSVWRGARRVRDLPANHGRAARVDMAARMLPQAASSASDAKTDPALPVVESGHR